MTATQQHRDAAYALGVEHAKNAASWLETDDPARLLELMDAGDPRVDEYLPAQPNLSGEFADDPTPLSLARDIIGREDEYAYYSEEIDELADAYEAGVSDTFMPECERILRAAVES